MLDSTPNNAAGGGAPDGDVTSSVTIDVAGVLQQADCGHYTIVFMDETRQVRLAYAMCLTQQQAHHYLNKFMQLNSEMANDSLRNDMGNNPSNN